MGKANAANQAAQATAKAKAQAKAKPGSSGRGKGRSDKGKGKRKDGEQGGESGRVAVGNKSRNYRKSSTYWKLKCNRLEEEVKRLTKLLNDKTCYTRETLRTRRKKYLRESLKGQRIAPDWVPLTSKNCRLGGPQIAGLEVSRSQGLENWRFAW